MATPFAQRNRNKLGFLIRPTTSDQKKKKEKGKKMSCFSVGHLSAVNQRDWQAHMLPVERAMEGKNRLMYRRGSGRGKGRERERERALSPTGRK